MGGWRLCAIAFADIERGGDIRAPRRGASSAPPSGSVVLGRVGEAAAAGLELRRDAAAAAFEAAQREAAAVSSRLLLRRACSKGPGVFLPLQHHFIRIGGLIMLVGTNGFFSIFIYH